MSDYTAAEIDVALQENEGDNYGEPWSALFYYDYSSETLPLRGEEVPFELVESYDGGDREWEYEVYAVIKVGDQYFKREGVYRSHEGVTLDSATREVVEATKTVKVWNDK
jgi:hypothetical protein